MDLNVIICYFFSPICFDMIEEAHMTKCGHSFWYEILNMLSLFDKLRYPKIFLHYKVGILCFGYSLTYFFQQLQMCEEKPRAVQ